MIEEQVRTLDERSASADELLILSHQLGLVQRKNWVLRGGILGLLAFLALMGGVFFNHFVCRYAAIDNIRIIQDTVQPRRVLFEFTVRSDGLVRRGFEKAISEDTVPASDHIQRYTWEWYVPPTKKEFTVYIRSRWWILPTWQTKTFSVMGAA